MVNYNNLPDRIDVDIKGNIYVQKLPGDDRVGLLCPYSKEQFTVCNVRCAKCSVVLDDDECWRVTCCGTEHRAGLLYRQHHAGSMELQYHEVGKQYD